MCVHMLTLLSCCSALLRAQRKLPSGQATSQELHFFASNAIYKGTVIYLFYSQISSENNKSNVIAFKGYLIMHNQSIIEIFLCSAFFWLCPDRGASRVLGLGLGDCLVDYDMEAAMEICKLQVAAFGF